MQRRSQIISATATTAGGQILASSKDRVALIFGCPDNTRVTLSSNPSPTLDQGINLYPGNTPLYLDRHVHGEIVQSAWFAIAATASQPIGIIEVLEGDNG